MANILILFAHPALEKSRIQIELLHQARKIEGVTINDLYENYPEFDIDVAREKKLLLAHDIIIWQHPFFWYSSPALLKQWQDLVLEHGWAYGRKGSALAGKRIFNALTSGGGPEGYRHGGYNKYSLHEYLRPFQRTAELCKMFYWPPFWVPGVHRMEKRTIGNYGEQFKNLLTALKHDLVPEEEILAASYLNDLFPINETQN